MRTLFSSILLLILSGCITVMVDQPLAPDGGKAVGDLPATWLGIYRTLDEELTANEIGTEYVQLEETESSTYLLSRFLYVEDEDLDTLGFRREGLTLILRRDSALLRLQHLQAMEPDSLSSEQKAELEQLEFQEELGELILEYPLEKMGKGYRYVTKRLLQLDFDAGTIRFYAEDTTAPPGNFVLHRWDATRWIFNLQNPEELTLWVPYVLTYRDSQLRMTQLNDEELSTWAEDKPEVILTSNDNEILIEAPLSTWETLLNTPLLWEPFFEWEKDNRWELETRRKDSLELTDGSPGMSMNLLIILVVVLIGTMIILRILARRK
ncbi:MAG: hypothetical protein AAFQ98_15075 [Bacteroidota bacterium]